MMSSVFSVRQAPGYPCSVEGNACHYQLCTRKKQSRGMRGADNYNTHRRRVHNAIDEYLTIECITVFGSWEKNTSHVLIK